MTSITHNSVPKHALVVVSQSRTWRYSEMITSTQISFCTLATAEELCATPQVNVYELLVELLESTGADRLETEDPARLRAGAEAKLAEITEVLLLTS